MIVFHLFFVCKTLGELKIFFFLIDINYCFKMAGVFLCAPRLFSVITNIAYIAFKFDVHPAIYIWKAECGNFV